MRMHLTRWMTVTGLAAASAVACGFPPLPGPPADAEPLPLLGFPDTIIRVPRSAYEFTQQLLIRDSVSYLIFWDTLALVMPIPKPSAPPVNFETHMVIAAIFGKPDPRLPQGSVRNAEVPSANTSLPQWSIDIESVHYDPREADIWIQARSYEPTRSCGVVKQTAVVTAVRVPRREGTPRWVQFGQAIVCD